ncbi:MAG: DUF2867 domain-containing protein [Acidobacteriota bacterium]
MRLTNDAHRRHTWWVHDYARDFDLLDVWQYPIEAESEDDFAAFLKVHDMKAMVEETSIVVRLLFAIRMGAGRLFGWDDETDDLDRVGFEEVYRDHRELVLRTENATVTALMHLGWVPLDNGRWTAQMAVYAIPAGRLGRFYMALIGPFRHGFVYPALMRAGRRRWQRHLRGELATA